MYLRFVSIGKIVNTPSKAGLFDSAYAALRSNEIDELSAQRIERLIFWFEENLKEPNRFNRSKSKGYYRRNNTSISWFKSTAADHLEKAFELAALLNEHGILIEVIKATRVGYVIYEDEHQVVAEPFSDTRT